MLEQLQNGQEHFWRIVETTLPIGVFLLEKWRREKNQKDLQHAENQKKLADLVIQNKYLPAHAHDDKSGALTVEYLRFDPRVR